MMKNIYFILFLLSWGFGACKAKQDDKNKQNSNNTANELLKKQAPDWFNTAIIYEANIRQMTPSGTLKEFATHLERLNQLGVNVVWLMPIYPVAKVKRKGTMGSPYAVANYKEVNPDYGTKEDLDNIIKKAHELGMKIILDFVPNHTGWDHIWIKEHPDWYVHKNDTICHPHDREGKPTDWYDVADLNYDNQEMRKEMIECMKYWVKEHDIDGYRMDVAGFVPNDFWEEVRPALQSIKPILMLSEWEDVPQHFESCFEINYGWDFHHLINDIAQGKQKANDLWKHYAKVKQTFPADATQLLFITNHDENTWNGTEFKRMGKAVYAMAALTFTFEGVPLIYAGQEVENKKQIKFFDKDLIDFPKLNQNHAAFYQKLTSLKKRNKALWNGLNGGGVEKVTIEEANGNVFAFKRIKDNEKVLCFFNMSDKALTTKLIGTENEGEYLDVMNNKAFKITQNMTINLPAWGFQILEKKQN